MSSDLSHWFCADYVSARARFREAARRTGAALRALPLSGCAPDGSALSIDVAWLGAPEPARAVLHSSGLHGVEGFAGSAIQLALLAQPPSLPCDGALILVHTLNPYGMAWLRRCNEHNVDLNRNFDDTAPRTGAAASYRLLDGLLNPRSPPRRDAFYLRAAYYVVRYGLEPLKQAIAGGQYEYPEGLFFGGHALEQGPAIYQGWLAEYLAGIGDLYVVDVHTGLGRWAEDLLVVHRGPDDLSALSHAIGRPLSRDVFDAGLTYSIRGGYARAFDVLESTRTCLVTQEFGTYPAVPVLHALREENRAVHYADAGAAHPAKLRLKEMFAPRSARWRARVVARGLDLAEAVIGHTFR